MSLANQPSLRQLRSRFGTRPLSEGVVSQVADKTEEIVSGIPSGSDGFDSEGYDAMGYDIFGFDRQGNRWMSTAPQKKRFLGQDDGGISQAEADRRFSDPDYALWKYLCGVMTAGEYLSCCNPLAWVRKWMDGLSDRTELEGQPNAEEKKHMRELGVNLGVLAELDSVMEKSWQTAYEKSERMKRAKEKTWVDKSGKPWLVFNRNG